MFMLCKFWVWGPVGWWFCAVTRNVPVTAGASESTKSQSCDECRRKDPFTVVS